MITINGTDYVGRNIIVRGDKITIDGVTITPEDKVITISVNGNIDSLDVAYCKSLTIQGEVGSVKTASADVEVIGDIRGGVQTMSGDVTCRNVGGSVRTMSGDVTGL
jgi:hypothetical protein